SCSCCSCSTSSPASLAASIGRGRSCMNHRPSSRVGDVFVTHGRLMGKGRPCLSMNLSVSHSSLNQVITGDCLKLLPLLPAASVDMILTDPPYLVRYQSRDGRRVLNDDTDTWLAPAFAESYRVLKRDRFCVSFCGFTQADRFLAAWKAAGFRVLEHVVWRKRYPSSTGFVRRYHEQAYVLAKGHPRRPKLLLPSVLEWRYTGDTLHP